MLKMRPYDHLGEMNFWVESGGKRSYPCADPAVENASPQSLGGDEPWGEKVETLGLPGADQVAENGAPQESGTTGPFGSFW